MLAVAALDGVSINHNGLGGSGVVWQNHLGVPPGGRVHYAWVVLAVLVAVMIAASGVCMTRQAWLK